MKLTKFNFSILIFNVFFKLTLITTAGWQLIDLCCGSSLTTALCLAMLPGVVVTPCDIVGKETLPHFRLAFEFKLLCAHLLFAHLYPRRALTITFDHLREAGLADRTSYCQHDIMKADFVPQLREGHLRDGMRYVGLRL